MTVKVTRLGRRITKQIFAILALSAMTACSQDNANELRNTTLKLYSFQADGSNVQELVAGSTIPYKATSCYGWRLTFDPIDAQIPIDELLLLPDQANEWSVETGAIVADDKTSAQTRFVVSGQKGIAEKSWCVAPGDPVGQYKFVITYQQMKVGELPFRLAQ